MFEKRFPSSFSAAALRKRFKSLRETDINDPLANPVRRFASEVFQLLEHGEAEFSAIEGAVSSLELESFEARAKNFHTRLDPERGGFCDCLKNLRDLEFEEFRRRVEKTPVGVVFTAHPTFALGEEQRALIATYPGEENKSELERWRRDAAAAMIAKPVNITLGYEHDQARKAIKNAQDAVRALNAEIFDYARRRYPENWSSLSPNPISLASWVGYDLDGRTDIHWSETVRIRLEEKASQLHRYQAALESILSDRTDQRLQTLADLFGRAFTTARAQTEAFAGDMNDPSVIVRAANLLTETDEGRLVSLEPAISTLSNVIEESADDAMKLKLCLLRAEMKAYGLGVARIHLRVNAAQVRSALRVDLGLDADSDFSERSALETASQKAGEASKRSINFGSIFLEQMTARRQLMLCAQILKHIDADTPIRFLIAECEAPATVMGAVYLARLYGVDGKLDISPLFETPQAMERGGRFIERLLSDPEYCDYVRKRKRMTIQIGFSDSGRFIGQCPAALAIERLQILFARALGKAGLKDVEALIFNTHGESMGRGGHPGGLRERLNHLATPWAKSRFHKENIFLNCEYSFQGGEGFLWYQTPALSTAIIKALWEHASETPPTETSDRYYNDINFSWDVYRGLKSWQEALFDRDDYLNVLFAFPQHLLYETGSRKTKRPEPGGSAPEIRSMRAIPHNAILQQLAMPANVSGGVGFAGGREIDRFVEHVRASPRMRELMAMAFKARSLTSISILRAYAGIYSPAYWSSLAGAARHGEKPDIYEEILQALLRADVGNAIGRLADYLARDLRSMDAIRDMLAEFSESSSGVDSNLGVLHAIRQALIAHSAALVAGVPDFSSRHDVSKHDLIDMALQLRMREVSDLLKAIFPKECPAGALIAGLKEPIEGDDVRGGAYPEVHATVINPLDRINDVLETISRAISNHYGAYG